MLKALWKDQKPSGLLSDALEEVYRMLEDEAVMFRSASHTLLTGEETDIDVAKKDESINIGEQMVRRLVAQHLNINPQQDLPSSMVLIGIVHDVERIGDYTKGLIELAAVRPPDLMGGPYADVCTELVDMIQPMIQQTLDAFRESDDNLARKVMSSHREIKIQTDNLVTTIMNDPTSGREATYYCIGARILRRISAHLSNIVSGIANPFDLLGRND